jgi:hypothetical protein
MWPSIIKGIANFVPHEPMASKRQQVVGVSKGWLDDQTRPEEWIAGGRGVLRLDLLTTGHQVITDFGSRIACLCPDAKGTS